MTDKLIQELSRKTLKSYIKKREKQDEDEGGTRSFKYRAFDWPHGPKDPVDKAKDRLAGKYEPKTMPYKLGEELKEEETLLEARIKIIKARIRGGKIQRRKKVSNVPGMTLRGGKLKRMSPTERRNRKMGQRKGKMKRKAKLVRTLQKRKRSLQKRQRLGLR